MKNFFRNWPSKMVAVVIAILIIVISRNINTEVRFLTIPLTLLLHEDMIPSESHPSEVRLRMRGSPAQISGVQAENLRAVIDLTRQSESGSFQSAVEIQRSGAALGVDPLEIRVEPQSVELSIEQKLRKLVAVEASTTGFPPLGYQLVSSQVIPESLLIEGPQSRVVLISSVGTEDVDFSEKRESFAEKVNVVYDDSLIRFPAGAEVEYRAVIEEILVLNTFEPVDILLIDLAEHLTVVSSIPRGSVRVQGRVFSLENVEARDLQLLVDASSIVEPGSYELATEPSAPGGLTILQFDPAFVRLEVSERKQGNGGP